MSKTILINTSNFIFKIFLIIMKNISILIAGIYINNPLIFLIFYSIYTIFDQIYKYYDSA